MAEGKFAVAQPNSTSDEPPSHSLLGRRRSFFIGIMLAAVVLVGLLLRLETASTRSIWFDEAWSWRMSRFPVAELIERTAADVHPPLYYFALKAWTTVWGDSPLAMRSMSALFGALAIVAAYQTVRQAYPRFSISHDPRPIGAALFVAALVAFSVFQIRYGWEARMYALGVFLYAASGAALFRALRSSSNPWKWWAVYGGLITLFAYTHYFALLSIAAQGLFLVGFFLVQAGGRWRILTRDAQAWRALATFTIFTLALLPWAPIFLRQLHQVHDDFWPSSVGAWSLPVACYQMFVDPENASSYHADAASLAIGCLCILAVLLWKARALEWYAFCGAVVPCAAAFFLALGGMRVFYVRYLVFAHLALLTALGLVVWRLPTASLRLFAALLILANFLAANVRFLENMDPAQHGGARAAAASLAAGRHAGEPIVVSTAFFYFPLQYYLRDDDCRLFQGAAELHHFQGVPLLIASDKINAAEVKALRAKQVWIVDARASVWQVVQVPTPAAWVFRGEASFQECFPFQGQVVVEQYDASSGWTADSP